MSKAFFLDRDGVINVDHGHVGSVEKFDFIEGVFEACRKINELGFKIIIVTNQSGIARGYYTEEDFNTLTNWMIEEFEKNDVKIDDVFYCPHHPEKGSGKYLRDCQCRKPNPGMILDAAAKHKLNLKLSVLVGDKVSDILAAEKAGLDETYLINSKYLTTEQSRVYDSLHHVVEEFKSSSI
ncbi:D-glycero-beta-D-manno-heptose 1,7-bisphosphate 7-phosphatase [Vibrio sp. 10N.247.311.18]|uniref:D-glycero-beta-D-manno-heptose 1,7-bisphosphate 7-phosphatase n=1 Tax=unclassified Vibrio TaxID=2614977 RepID=UPI0035536FAF